MQRIEFLIADVGPYYREESGVMCLPAIVLLMQSEAALYMSETEITECSVRFRVQVPEN